MTLSIRPVPLLFILLALIIWLSKPAVASKPQPLSKVHGMTADEVIDQRNQRMQQNFRRHYEAAINR